MLDNIAHEAYVFFISMLPLFELRLSIPYGILNQLPWQETFLLAIAGNFVPIIPLLLLLEKVLNFLNQFEVFSKFYNYVMEKTYKNKGIVEKYGKLGLFIFVAIPLPGSGVYTGSAIAMLLGMKKRDSFPALTLGMILAGVLVTSATMGVVNIFDNPAFVILFILISFFIYKKISRAS
ncbi:MAG: hypothetical protein EOM04_03735 [Clostridia bacterium]|nr:hypothetical protein [Clostridia bacterium]